MTQPTTVTVLRAGRDRHGDRGTAASHTIDGCILAPRSSSESQNAADTVIVGLTLYAPPGADVQPTDQIQIGTLVYDIDGEAGVWSSPFDGTTAGVEVALRRVTG